MGNGIIDSLFFLIHTDLAQLYFEKHYERQKSYGGIISNFEHQGRTCQYVSKYKNKKQWHD